MTSMVQNIKYSRAINLSSSNHTGHWRVFTPCHEIKLSPCQGSCPCDSQIPAWLAAVNQGQWERAWQITAQTNPFPAITGRVCYRYCQDTCYRRQLDEAVAIAEIEQEIGRWRHSRPLQPLQAGSVGKVAIVGSGPAGLSCAYYLRQQGFQVTIYDRAATPGGMLALAIPPYRLPRRILDRELEMLARDGVRFRLNCRQDPQTITGGLLTEYRAVFLATGTPDNWLPDIPGLELSGVWAAFNFLRETNLRGKVKIADPVIVIGGGNTALDAARVALRQEGITKVTVLYRRKRADMKAHPVEIKAAEEEGINFIFDTYPEAIYGSGRVEGIVCSLADNRPPVAGPGDYRCGTLILATGLRPDESLTGLCQGDKPLFAGGDQLVGPSSVPAAIAEGRRGAKEIIAFLQREAPVPSPTKKKEISFSDLHLNTWPGLFPQVKSDHPLQESGRCLSCGSCNHCGICAVFCPEVAVSWDGEQYSINLDYCKGCGICAWECPSGVLEMRGVKDVP